MLFQLTDNATPIIIDRNGINATVGSRVETPDFTFDCIEDSDGTYNVYIEWGDDQGGDMLNFPSWHAVKNHLDSLLQASHR